MIRAANQVVEQALKDEYKSWRCEPPLLTNNNLANDPIRYWQAARTRYPILSWMALGIYLILASSANYKRVFSELSNLLCSRRF
jgi:hypothetical protein